MKRTIFKISVACIIITFLSFLPITGKQKETKNIPLTNYSLQTYQNLPLYFVENKGQLNDESIRYSLKLPYGNVYFKSNEIIYQFIHQNSNLLEDFSENKETNDKKYPKIENLRLRFFGANKQAKIEGLEKKRAKFSYFRGRESSNWIKGINTFSQISYENLYPNIDLIVHGEKNKVKYDFRVRPGGDYNLIKMSFKGYKEIEIDENGDLIISTDNGKLKEKNPFSYQIIDQKKVQIESSYTIIDNNKIGFKIKNYRNENELIIDPEIVYSSYFGGTNSDDVEDIKIDEDGNIYIIGTTRSHDFPTTPSAYQTSIGGDELDHDVFLSKFDFSTFELIFSTYIGGSSWEFGYSLDVDFNKNIIIGGSTCSNDFPTTPGVISESHIGDYDIFITKIDSTGSFLIYSTLFGSAASDTCKRISVDTIGNVNLCGYTESNNFPNSPNAFQSNYAGGSTDGVLAKINSTGSAIIYSTYFGGTGSDCSTDMRADINGNTYVTGYTDSLDFPIYGNVIGPDYNGGSMDTYILKINSTGTNLIFSTYIGGSDHDEARGIEIDTDNNIYLTGLTKSSDFPTTVNVFDSSFNGEMDVFVSKINSTGTNFVYSTYLGGNNIDIGYDIEIDNEGNCFITGSTKSTDFPVDFMTGYSGDDAFITELNSNVSDIIYSTYFGGNSGVLGKVIALNNLNCTIVGGLTWSDNLIITSNPFEDEYMGNGDIFILEIAPNICDKPDNFNNTYPLNNTTTHMIWPDLEWEESSGAIYYDVFFGQNNPPPKIARITDCTYNLGELEYNSTYYWKIIAINMCGDKSGEKWSFKTALSPVAIRGNTIGDGVKISFSNGGGLTFSDSTGDYTHTIGYGWSGTITPSKTGYSFDPSNRSYTNVTSDLSGQNFTPIVIPHTVSKPDTPSGSEYGDIATIYTFNTGGSICSHGHDVEYQFNWGDGTYSGWLSSTQAQYSWSEKGIYTIKAQGRCSVNTNIESEWSDGINIAIGQNSLTITSSSGGTTDPNPGTYDYYCGSEISIQAIPDNNYKFNNWSGDIPTGHENDNPIIIAMDSNKTITANFLEFSWSPLKRLTWNGGHSFKPSIAMDSENRIHLVWYDQSFGNNEILYKQSSNFGSNWSALKRLTWNSGDSSFPDITTDTNNGIHIIWSDNSSGNYEILYKYSSNSGLNWSAPIQLTWNSSVSGNPSIAANPGSRIHFIWSDGKWGNNEICYKNSSDSGVTWSNIVRLTWNSGNSSFPAITVDSESGINIVWCDDTFGNYEIFYKQSSDNGTTWSGINRLSWNQGNSLHPSIITDSSKGIHVVWHDLSPGNYEIFYKNKYDSGTGWSGQKRLTWNNNSSNFPDIITDSNNRVQIVWADYTPNNWEIYFKQSIDRGISWSRITRLTWNGGSSSHPIIEADSSMGINVVWDDDTPGNCEIYYKRRK